MTVETRVDEVADGIYRLSTNVEGIAPGGFTFNQFLVDAEQPLLFHTGLRQMFPLISAALARVMPLERLRWISFGHFEADECGSMNDWLEAAPNATLAVGTMACLLSVNDQASRPPRALGDGEVLDLGGKRVRHVATPHVPHQWEAQVLYEETTNTLLGGDLFTHAGNGPAVTEDNIVGAALETEEQFRGTSPTPLFGPTVRRLADLEPLTIGCMHGSSFRGDGGALLRELAKSYEERFVPAG
jgi:flavorubredoxin